MPDDLSYQVGPDRVPEGLRSEALRSDPPACYRFECVGWIDDDRRGSHPAWVGPAAMIFGSPETGLDRDMVPECRWQLVCGLIEDGGATVSVLGRRNWGFRLSDRDAYLDWFCTPSMLTDEQRAIFEARLREAD